MQSASPNFWDAGRVSADGAYPMDLRGIIGAYHRCCTELIEHNGGFVAQ